MQDLISRQAAIEALQGRLKQEAPASIGGSTFTKYGRGDRMKIYYVSHPYGGKQKNEAKADAIVRALQTEYPDICFVSPVHAIRCPYSKTDYIQGLDYCLELLRRCDGIVMCGNWQDSIGCVSEFILAREICKDVKTADKMLVGTGWDEALAYARGEEFA